MILVVTPNPALDVTYEVDALRLGHANRVQSVHERAGGKGLNVARLVHAYGVPVLAVAPVGGSTGVRVADLLSQAGVPHDLMPVDSETRRTVVASCASSDSTGFWEPGPELTAAEWSAYCTLVSRHLADADVVVFSGSLPRGWPESAYAQLIGLARAGGVPSILDTSGAAFRHGIAAGPQLAKPNAAELADLVNMAVDDVASAVVAIAAARELGARDLVVSLGPDGVVASVGFDETVGSSNPVGSSAVWVGSPPDRFAGNATGAGDAMVAALAVGVLRGDAWPDRLRRMIAWSAAAAAHPVAGEIDVELAARLAALSTCELVERSA